MPVKPSQEEDEYFARIEVEKLRKIAEERQAKLAAEERERARKLHHMKCPKCGMDLEEFVFSGVTIDKCFACGGVWLDDRELEMIRTKERGFVDQVLKLFK